MIAWDTIDQVSSEQPARKNFRALSVSKHQWTAGITCWLGIGPVQTTLEGKSMPS